MSAEAGILLDTHIWAWLINGSAELNNRTIKLLDGAAREGKLFVPEIAIWELATLVAKKRLTLGMPIKNWVEEAMQKPGIEMAPLSWEISIESTMLPGVLHTDPADRIIIATARIKKLSLVTRDEKIQKYSQQGHVTVIKA
jgi:PIN domain nuclease of toxin-antitoxin system